MIKILFLIISVFLLLFLESFLLRIFSFSFFIIILLLLRNRVNDIIFYSFVVLFGVALDSVLHTPLGTHILVLATLLLLLEFFDVLISTDSKSRYIPIFFSISLYYLLLATTSSLLSAGVLPTILLSTWINIIIKAVISTVIYIFFTRFTKSLRSDQKGEFLRLS